MACLEAFRVLPIMEAPTMPDGSKALLSIDQSACNKHQLSAHGWPPNNIQEYANTENKSLQEMFLKNVEKVAGQVDELAGFTPEQKAALCFNRAAQTASEFCDEALRLDRVRQRLVALKDSKSVDPDKKIQFNPLSDGEPNDE